MPTYRWLRLRADDRAWNASYDRLPSGDPGGLEIWGAFSGLFGIGSNELFLVLHGEGATPLDELSAAGFEVIESHDFVPTVRPGRFEPRTRNGLYVFRFFEVGHDDVDEIARLSMQAWETFERTDDYAAAAQALFAPADRSEPTGTMLLVTWYDGFESWESSRAPAPEATENFRRRRELTRSAIAYATRLVEP